MQKISMDELKDKLRRVFRDEYKIQWSDELLDGILFEAQREYIIYSADLIAQHEIIASKSAAITLPEDFFQIVKVLDPNGNNIPIVSYRYLAEMYGDFRKKQGDKIKYLCFNFDGLGKCRTYPQIPEGTVIGTIYYKRIPAYGEWLGFNATAIEKYALFQMYQFLGKKQAQNEYESFINIINRNQRNSLSVGGKNIKRIGVYF